MKKLFYTGVLIICCFFISFFLLQSQTIPEKIANISGWVLLALNPLINLFPKIKAQLMICIARIVNYNTELNYCVRIDLDSIDEKMLENKIRNNIVGFERLLKNSPYRWKIQLDRIDIDISISEDSVYLSFQKLKIGYRDIIKQIDYMNEIVDNILTKVIKHYDSTIFDCVICFDNRNPYLGFMISDKINDINMDVIIKSDSFVITNNQIKYTDHEIMKFSNKLKKELLLK